MMDEIGIYEGVLQTVILPIAHQAKSLQERELVKKQTTLEESSNHLKDRVYRLLTSHEDDQFISRTVTTHYYRIASLSNSLLKDFNIQKPADLLTAPPALTKSLESLDSMLVFYKKATGPYLENSVCLTIYHVYEVLPDLKRRYSDTLKKLKRYCDPWIVECLEGYDHQFGHIPQDIRLRDLRYYKKLLMALEALLDKSKKEDRQREVWKLFVRMDFNRPEMEDYVTERIQKISRAGEPIEHKLQELLDIYYDVHEIHLNPEYHYAPDAVSLKDLVLKIVEAERQYLQQQQNDVEWAEVRKESRSILVDTSIKVLCLLAEICVKAAFIPSNSVRQVIRIFGLFIKTPKSTIGSFEKAYDKADYHDRVTVQGLSNLLKSLMDTLQATHQNFMGDGPK